MNIVFLVVLVAVFYVLLVLPQSRRRKQAMALQRTIVPGSRIVTTSGIFGTVVEVEDDALVVEIADDVEIRMLRGAIMRVVEEASVFDAEDAEEADDDVDDAAEDAEPSVSDVEEAGDGDDEESAPSQSEAPLGWVGADATAATASGTDESAAGPRGGRWRVRSR